MSIHMMREQRPANSFWQAKASTPVDPITQMGEQLGNALANAIGATRARIKQKQQWDLYARHLRAIGKPELARIVEFANQSGGATAPSPLPPVQPAVQPVAVPASQPTPAPAKAPSPPAFSVATATPEDIAKRADDLHGDLDLAMRWIGQPTPTKADVERAETLVQQGQALYDAVCARAEASQDHAEVLKLFGYQMRRMGTALPGFRWQTSVARARLTP